MQLAPRLKGKEYAERLAPRVTHMADRLTQITSVIMERPLCLDCIGTKTNLNDAAVEDFLTVMARVIDIRQEHGRCEACGAFTDVVSIWKPSA